MRPLLLLLACLLSSAASAADGIQTGVPFHTPFAVDGQRTINRSIVSVDAEGTIVLTIHFLKGQEIEVAEYELIRQDAPGPEPGPEPQPDPNPPAELWAIVVEESGERTAQQAIVMADPEIRGLFKASRFRIVDQDEAAADMRSYVKRATDKGMKLPALFLVSPEGKVHFEGDLPATVAETKALVRKILGKAP